MRPTGINISQFVFACPCRTPNRNISISLPKMSGRHRHSGYASAYKPLLQTRSESHTVQVPQIKSKFQRLRNPCQHRCEGCGYQKAAHGFLFSGSAHLYIANAAPGRPKIIRGNLPVINLVAETAKWVVPGSASCAKKIF